MRGAAERVLRRAAREDTAALKTEDQIEMNSPGSLSVSTGSPCPGSPCPGSLGVPLRAPQARGSRVRRLVRSSREMKLTRVPA